MVFTVKRCYFYVLSKDVILMLYSVERCYPFVIIISKIQFYILDPVFYVFDLYYFDVFRGF